MIPSFISFGNVVARIIYMLSFMVDKKSTHTDTSLFFIAIGLLMDKTAGKCTLQSVNPGEKLVIIAMEKTS